MFKFLFGVAFGAAAYWAWQSFGRDLMGMSDSSDTSYGGFNNSSSSFGTASPSTSFGTGDSSASSTPANSASSSSVASTSSGSSNPTA